LKTIKNVTKANEEWDNYEILEIVCGKLTKSAGIWFDNNESSFKRWSDFEIKQSKQSQDESVTLYYDKVVNLCRKIDPNMSNQIII
jgi:hypothetical protein